MRASNSTVTRWSSTKRFSGDRRHRRVLSERPTHSDPFASFRSGTAGDEWDGGRMRESDLDNPILNTPYDPPEQHFELGPDGPTGETIQGRRPSESFIPVPPSKKGKTQA